MFVKINSWNFQHLFVLRLFQKAIVKIFLFAYFCNPLNKSTWKMMLNAFCWAAFACKTFWLFQCSRIQQWEINTLVKLKKHYFYLFFLFFQLMAKNMLLVWNVQSRNAAQRLLDLAMLVCTFVARSNVKMNQIDHEPDTTIGFIALLNLSNWTYFSLLCAYLNKISTYCKSYPFIY